MNVPTSLNGVKVHASAAAHASSELLVNVTGGTIPVQLSPPAPILLILAHGAGGTVEDPLLIGLAQRLPPLGVAVARVSFLYRTQGKKLPDKQPVLDRTFHELALALMEQRPAATVVLGGKSMGGRVAARVAQATGLGAGVCLLSYPLKPKARVTEANLMDRQQTLERLTVPCFVAQGTRDPFGGPSEVSPHLQQGTIFPVDHGDHDLRAPRRSAKSDEQRLDELSHAIEEWIVSLERLGAAR